MLGSRATIEYACPHSIFDLARGEKILNANQITQLYKVLESDTIWGAM